MKAIKWLDDHFEEALLTIGLVVIVIVLTLQIIFRKLLGTSLAWSEELCRYIFMWSGMLTLSFTLRNGTAMKTDLFINMMPVKVRQIINLLMQVFLLILFAVMTKVSLDVVPTINQMGTAIPISRGWIYMSLPVGFALSFVRTIQNMFTAWKTLSGKEEKTC